MRMKYEPNRYQVNYGDQYQQYRDKEWSIHSAECIASFFNTIARVVDTYTGNMVAAAIPNENGIGVRTVRYASEIVYAVERLKDLSNLKNLKVLSFGCGPCTDLFAIDYLRSLRILSYQKLEYRGVDYSEDVWKYVHRDIKTFENKDLKIGFYYQDACKLIHTIAQGSWVPNLIVFQYVFSDMKKHSDVKNINDFIETFAQYYNEKVAPNTYIILNDVNLGRGYGGGRDYFDQLCSKLCGSISRKGRFCNDNSKSEFYPRGYPYGKDSDGEFPKNENRFDWSPWDKYSPFDTCASAQMIIKKVAKK